MIKLLIPGSKRAYQSIFVQTSEDSVQGGQTLIYIQSGTVVLKMPHLTFLICTCKRKKKKKRCRCLINCCLDKSSRGMVEDDADDRSIMPQRRLEKPTIERRSCHSILQNAPHQRVSLCHSSRQDEITHSDIFPLSLKLCQCSVCDIKFRKRFTQSSILWLIYLGGNP